MKLRVLRLRKTRYACVRKQEDTKNGNEGMGLIEVMPEGTHDTRNACLVRCRQGERHVLMLDWSRKKEEVNYMRCHIDKALKERKKERKKEKYNNVF